MIAGAAPAAVAPALSERVSRGLERPIRSEVAGFAAVLAEEFGAVAVLFYGSNLRTGALDGVLDFYVLLPGRSERGLWPRVAYRERCVGDAGEGGMLRAKVAVMRLATFADAAAGRSLDTTIWTRFVQPSGLAWARDAAAREKVADALADAAISAASFAAALGPAEGSERDFWQALFRATYRAELRVEKPGRELQILDYGATHFDGLLAAAWDAAGISWAGDAALLRPLLDARTRRAILSRWMPRRRLGRPLNLLRVLRAATTFEGGARYLAWKVERHSGIRVRLTPWRERHPLLAAPVLVGDYLRQRRARARSPATH